MRLAWDIARRYLAPRRSGRILSFITWVSLGGVTVGVTSLIVVIAVMTGAKEDFRDKILDVNPHVTILESGSSLRMGDWRQVLDTVRKVEGVVSATPFAVTQVMLSTTYEYSQPALLYGIAMGEMGEAATGIEERIQSGELPLEETESGYPPLLVGTGLAYRMSVFPGDTVVLMSAEGVKPGPMGNLVPRMRNFEVTGTFKTGLSDYDMSNVYAHMEDVQELMGSLEDAEISGIGVRGEDALSATALANVIEEAIGFPYDAQSWAETNNALFSALALEKLAMWVILFLIVVVAAFNIVSTLVTVVVDRTREIGILKSMGMTNDQILKVFVFQGTWIGVIGTSIGTALGCGIAWLLDTFEIIRIPPDVYFVDRLPVALHLSDVLVIFMASVAVAFVATIYPAIQASRMEPVEAIRHE
jgi:lipoprotein-releasing system permease protein